MGYFGILPTPNSPKIHSTNMNMYVKHSYYPIPYQVVCAIESCNVDSISSWDINVTEKTIKVKVQYDLTDKVQRVCDNVMFPKAVINSIKTYNVAQPTWSTSFNQKKLCLKIDWKLTSPSHDTSYISPSTFSTPANSTNFGATIDSGYKSYNNSRNIVDSGYISSSPANVSNSHRYVNKVNVPGPRTKLFHSPKKEFVQHDIYRPDSQRSVSKSVVQNTSTKIPNPKNSIDTSRLNKSNGRVSDDTGSQNFSTDVSAKSDNYSSSTQDPSHQVQPPSSQPLNPTPQPKDPTSQCSQSQDPISHDPSSQPPKLTPQQQDQTSQLTPHPKNPPHQPSYPPISKPSLPQPTQVLTSPHNPSTHNADSPSPDESNDIPIFDPANRFFWPCPNPLEVSDDGFLDDELEAYYMDIVGICRLCGDEVPSYLCELHLLECCELERDEVYDFYEKVATEIYSLSENIMEYAKQFCCGILTATSSPPEDFSNTESYQSFLRGLDQLFESLTSKVFDQLCIYDYRSRFNILKYQPKHSKTITL